jgi:hypothetical protein
LNLSYKFTKKIRNTLTYIVIYDKYKIYSWDEFKAK